MPNGAKGKIVDVGMKVTGSIPGVATVTTKFKVAVPQVANLNYTAKKLIRSPLIKTVPDVKGWRVPTPYVSAAAKRTAKGFSLVNIKASSSITTISGDSVPSASSSYGYAPSDTLFFNAQGVPIVSANTQAQAVTEALNKLQDARVQLGAALVESKETVEFIASTAITLVRVYQAARRGQWNKVAQLLGLTPQKSVKTAGDAWLAYKFGLVPLMSDISGAFDAFNTGMREKGADIHVSRQIEADVTPLFIPTGNWTSASQEGSVKELCKVVIYAKISDSFLASMNSWGAINPLSALWEGVGWSFVVDWLLPIGNFLNSMSGTVGLTFHGGTKTTRIYANLTYKVMPAVSGATMVGDPCITKYECLATQRLLYTDWPIPWLYIKNPLSSSHVSIAAALVASIK